MMKTEDKDYATPNRLAMYLEMGWSDFLISPSRPYMEQTTGSWPNPRVDVVRPDFYLQIADLCKEWSHAENVAVRSTCDIGAATGRLSYELASRFPMLEKIVAVEPSVGFSNWARRLLCQEDQLPPIPLLGAVGRELQAIATSRPTPLTQSTTAEVEVVISTAEEFRSAHVQFDLVTCLNVADRHPEPFSLVETLSQLVVPGGLLVCSSPLDFQLEWTPDEKTWLESLHQLFPPSTWSDVAESDVYYEFRHYNRAWTRFSCQVVCKRKIGCPQTLEHLGSSSTSTLI
jgi:SAM-dependent methyltransferase